MNDLSMFTLVSGDVPNKPIAGTNFSLVYSEATRSITFKVLTPPAATTPVTSWRLAIEGVRRALRVPVSALPYTFSFTPEDYIDIWVPQVALWTINIEVSALNSAGEGPASAPFALTIDQSDSWFIPAAKFTFEEVRSGTVNGATRVTVGDVTVPTGWDLHYYSGALPYNASNFGTIHTSPASPLIDANASVQTGDARATGSTSWGILLWEFEGSEQNLWFPASVGKQIVHQGLDTGLSFSVDPTIGAIGGKYPIGSALSVGFTAVGATLAPLYQWRIAGADIPGATSATYTPVASDDVKLLECDVTIRNALGVLKVRTPAVSVTYPAPTAVGSFANVSVSQQSGVSGSIDAISKFAGSGIRLSVSGSPAVSVNNTMGSISYSRSAVISPVTITVTATNSGGSVPLTFTLAITATGSTTPPSVQASIGGSSGGSANAAFTSYLTNDMILAFVFSGSVVTPIDAPALSGFSGQYLWNPVPLTSAQLTSVTGAAFYRRAASDGLDGLLGPWPAGYGYRYVVVRDVDWSDPIGAAIGVCAAGAPNVDHPGLTLEIANSVVLSFAAFASGVTGQVPGLRPGLTQLAVNAGSGQRHILGASASPAALWAAAADVANGGSTANSGRSYAAAVEVRGAATAAGITWPADVPAAHITVSEVTSRTENTAQGFTGGGHVKIVSSASLAATATTVSGSFTLVRNVLGDADSVPSDSNPAITAGATAYTSAVLAVGDTCYPQAWWKFGSGSSAQYKLAWSGASFQIQGLDDPVSITLPLLGKTGTGTGEARSYAVAKWNADNVNGVDNAAYFGGPMAAAAYDSFAGNTATDAYVIDCIKTGRDTYGGPSLSMGFVGQHDLPFVAAVAWARNTPRIWSQFSSTYKASLDLFMKGAAICAAGCAREKDTTLTPFKGSMLGRVNPSSSPGHNIGTPPAAIVAAVCAYFGSPAAVKTFLDTVDVTAFKALIDASNWTNMSKSFSEPRATSTDNPAPTLAQIQTRVRNWTRWGISILDQEAIWAAEMEGAFSKTITAGISQNGIEPTTIATTVAGAYSKYSTAAWAYGRGRAENWSALKADPEFVAIEGKIGGVQESNMKDAGGHRLSASYSLWSLRVQAIYTLLVFSLGVVNPKGAKALALRDRIDRGFKYQRLMGKHGWLSVAHIVQGGLPASPEGASTWKGGGDVGGWDNGAANDAKWGLSYSYAMGDAIAAIYAL